MSFAYWVGLLHLGEGLVELMVFWCKISVVGVRETKCETLSSLCSSMWSLQAAPWGCVVQGTGEDVKDMAAIEVNSSIREFERIQWKPVGMEPTEPLSEQWQPTCLSSGLPTPAASPQGALRFSLWTVLFCLVVGLSFWESWLIQCPLRSSLGLNAERHWTFSQTKQQAAPHQTLRAA